MKFLRFDYLLLGVLVFSIIAYAGDRRDSRTETVSPSATHLLPATPHEIFTLPFFDDFENGVGNWTSDGFFNLITDAQNYAILNPDINPNLVRLPDDGQLPSAYSGNGMWWFGEMATGTFIGSNFNTIEQSSLNGGTSVTDTSGSLITPAIDLSGVENARLQFRTWWEIEGVDVDAYDMMYVEISTDSGQTFQPLGNGHINPLNDVDGESWKPYSSGGLGEPGIWLEQLFDLSPYAGNVVYIRFRFDTIDELYNGFRGWFIDDVNITAEGLPAPEITDINPTVSAGGGLVNISGINFVNGAQVTVGGLGVSAIISTNLAVIEVPFLEAGTYDVTITNPDGQFDTETDGLTITDIPAPEIHLIDPDSVEEGQSQSLIIYGANFLPGAVVDIGGYQLNNATVDTFQITGDTPTDLPSGYHTVTVTNPDGQYDRVILGFHVYSVTSIGEFSDQLQPSDFKLMQNFPNPFNPETSIEFQLPASGMVSLTVYNLLGQKVQTVFEKHLMAGIHTVKFNAEHLNSGVYFYKLTSGNYSATRKFILMK